MQKTAAQEAYFRFCKRAEGGYDSAPYEEAMKQKQMLDQAIAEAEFERIFSSPQAQEADEQSAAFADPYYESPLERKRKIQGAGGAIGSGAGLLGGAVAGSMIPRSTLARALGGIGGGLGGMALGGLGGWGLGSLLAKSRMGQDYPEE
jgi:hypothetical protein